MRHAAAGQTGHKGGTMWQAIYRAVVLALLLPGAYSQMQPGWTLTSINGETNPSAWAVNRTDTLTLVVSYSCLNTADTATLLLRYAVRDHNPERSSRPAAMLSNAPLLGYEAYTMRKPVGSPTWCSIKQGSNTLVFLFTGGPVLFSRPGVGELHPRHHRDQDHHC